MDNNRQYLNLALKAAKESSKIFLKNFGNTSVRYKDSAVGSLVTDSDLAIEKIIRKHINTKFPDHLILGEEFGGKTKINKGQYLWIIDPIDGTTNFAYGIPLCCISITLWDYAGPLASVILNPISNEQYTAIRKQGAYLNGNKIRASKTAQLNQACGCFGWTSQMPQAQKEKMFGIASKHVGKARVLGTAELQLAFVALGRFDFFYTEQINLWDFAAGALLVTEAGGIITDWHGKKLSPESDGIIAAGPNLHQALFKKTASL